MGRISINDIKPLSYEGYLWMSDQEEPEVYDNKPITLPKVGDTPFVVEGQLFNKAKGLSYSIKFVDGQYIVQEYAVTEADKNNCDNEIKTYESNRMGDRRLQFLRYWEDDLDGDNYKDSVHPHGLPVLTQTKNVFIGFKAKEDSL